MTEMQRVIDDLERIAQHAELTWNGPAEQSAIAALENELRVELPDDYRRMLLWHDGTDDREFCSVDESRDVAAELREIWEDLMDDGDLDASRRTIEPGTGRVKEGDFVEGWVPFYDYGTGAFDLIDCNPGPRGVHGQIIHYDPNGTNGVTHPSLAAWAAEHARP